MSKLLLRTVFSGLILVAASNVRAAVILGSPTPLFDGIDLSTVQVDGSLGVVARIDLTAPGIGFTGSAPAPLGVTIPGTNPPTQAETVAQTTSQFLLGTGAQYAINAGFFAPCCTAANEGKDITGLTISNGVIVSPLDPAQTASLVISNDNRASVGLVTSVPANADEVVTGSNILVSGGRNVAPTASTDFNDANPRTAAGVSQDGRTLYLLTIDGRQAGYSPGASLVQTASVFLALGADAAVNLDGGGSTVAVAANGAGRRHGAQSSERRDRAVRRGQPRRVRAGAAHRGAGAGEPTVADGCAGRAVDGAPDRLSRARGCLPHVARRHPVPFRGWLGLNGRAWKTTARTRRRNPPRACSRTTSGPRRHTARSSAWRWPMRPSMVCRASTISTFRSGPTRAAFSVPSRLLAQYPHEMTIVLQHQFWDLKLDDAGQGFSVGLSFGGIPSMLSVPFAAVTGFADPHVQFGLRFSPPEEHAANAVEDTASEAAEEKTEQLPEPEAEPPTEPNQVVSLDAFRKRPPSKE